MIERFTEQRRFERHRIQVPLSVRPNAGEQFLSRVGDISEGGVSFTSPRALAIESAVEVVIPVHDSHFTLVGTVASCATASDGFRIGLKFVEPAASFKMKLAEQ